MKILNLRFKNLNSLYGEWEIDFTNQDFANNGIFAITGATGSGKTTILDAICLALYGSTPRLKNISKSSNDIMSRHTGECYSELLFQVQSGIYKVFWGQHRGKRSPDGNLMDARHEVSNGVTGQVFENKKRDVSNFITDITGLDLDRFTRSILLAQGSFSAFLKATPDERAPILEQITGTEIYTRISQKVHECLKIESDKKDLMHREAEGIPMLSESEIETLQDKIEEIDRKIYDNQKEELDISGKLLVYNELEKLKNELVIDYHHKEEVLKIVDDFKLEKESIEKAVRARDLEADFALYKKIIFEQNSDTTSLKTAKEKIFTLESRYSLSQKILKEKEDYLNTLKEEKSILQLITKEIRVLDYDIEQNSKTANEIELKMSLINKKLNEYKNERTGYADIVKSLNLENIKIHQFFEENKGDETLIYNLSGIKLKINEYEELSDVLKSKREKFNNLSEEIDRKRVDIDKEYKKLDEAKNRKTNLDKKLIVVKDSINNLLNGLLLREVRAELNSLYREISLLNRIYSLEEERKNLIEGEPCPLCGSLMHPVSQLHKGDIDENKKKTIDLEKLINLIESKEKDIEDLSNSIKEVANEIIFFEKSLSIMESDYAHGKSSGEKYYEELNELENSLKDKKDSLLKIVGDYKFNSLDNTMEIVDSLESRVLTWERNSSKRESIRDQLKDLENRLTRIEDSIKSEIDQSTELNDKLAEINKNIEEKSKKRYELFGDKEADTEEVKLESKIKNSMAELSGLINSKDLVKTQLVQLQGSVDNLEEKILKSESELNLAEKSLFEKIERAGFSNLDDLSKSIKTREELEILINKDKEIQKELTLSENNINSKQRKISELTALCSEYSQLQELEERIEGIRLELKKLSEEKGGIKQRLTDSEDSMKLYQEKLENIEIQKRICNRWQRLHNLIGSADGKKFRVFAQSLTFDKMIALSNRELVKMSDRYLLIRDSEASLQLNVIDNYHTGEIRSTKNLSGGESFIISLALALGLSKMSSKNVRIDSLFLDEGFGTLDEDTLDIALETLSGLKQEGKLIGVISHIPSLKQRISTQISIVKEPGGRGKIKGPGCRRL